MPAQWPSKAQLVQWRQEEYLALIKGQCQGGDEKASFTALVLRYLPKLQRQGGSLSAALEGWGRAVKRFNPEKRNGLWAYAQKDLQGSQNSRFQKKERLGFGDNDPYLAFSTTPVLFGVTSDPRANELTGGRPPRRAPAEAYKAGGYCSNGMSSYSRNAAFYKQDFHHIKLGQDAERRAIRRLEITGRQRFTEWRMQHVSKANTGDWVNGEWRPTERKRLTNEQPAPFRSKIAERYRRRMQSIEHIRAMDEIVHLRSHILKPQLSPRSKLSGAQLERKPHNI